MCKQCNYALEHTTYQSDSTMAALRRNYAPEGAVATELLRAIRDIDALFEGYDPEIARVQGILLALKQRRQSLQRDQECFRSVLSPVRRLPPEILQTIFVYCHGGPELEPIIPTAGLVCHHWRSVVLNTPELWSTICVGRTRFSFVQKYHDFASLFLERSANLPLSVSIRSPADGQLLHLIGRHIGRWQTLRLSSREASFYASLALHLHEFEALETLEIVEKIVENIWAEPPVPIALNAPKLREVMLNNCPAQFWNLPWRQLTHLRYSISAATEAIRTLELCPQLVECSISMLQVAPDEELPPCRPHRQLRTLGLAVDTTRSLIQTAESVLRTFFMGVTAPKLTCLKVIGQWSPHDVKDFLSRSECTLEHLVLGTGYMKDDKIIQVLEILPSLQTLELDADIGTTRQIQNRVITDKLLRRLVFFPDSDCLLPRLLHLTLRTALNFEDQVLLDVLESRWIPWVTELYGVPVSRMTSVDLHFRGRREMLASDSVELLRDLADAGLRVSLKQGQEQIPMFSSESNS
ncbi:hypothetical protein GGX14DRAFT_430431 [Mycena pura]|uniref:F-box domain-containing protein n=1 Tax=Mycena pura TaxID=153505 RepID=A0AAD6VTK5_9AGAR|nr:hypothetical protein GGX14DRAFT_430431 [Mycena pura]